MAVGRCPRRDRRQRQVAGPDGQGVQAPARRRREPAVRLDGKLPQRRRREGVHRPPDPRRISTMGLHLTAGDLAGPLPAEIVGLPTAPRPGGSRARQAAAPQLRPPVHRRDRHDTPAPAHRPTPGGTRRLLQTTDLPVEEVARHCSLGTAVDLGLHLAGDARHHSRSLPTHFPR
ncbi:hypothetical protein SGPA1_22033 [Streptomyces misionensis JCM 4497]